MKTIKLIIPAIIVGFCFVAILFQPEIKPVQKNITLDNVVLLQCGFAAEDYESPIVLNGVKFPGECACSELKGTCHMKKEIKTTTLSGFPEDGEPKHVCCGASNDRKFN